jgi:hypothetical protein
MTVGFVGLSESKRLPTLFEVGDPVLTALWTRGEDTIVEASGDIEGAYIELADEAHVLLYRRIEGYGSQPLVLGIRFPQASVDEELERLALSGLAGIVLLLLAVLAGVLMGKRIARPVIRLAKEASQIAGLEFG